VEGLVPRLSSPTPAYGQRQWLRADATRNDHCPMAMDGHLLGKQRRPDHITWYTKEQTSLIARLGGP
jgi:hypothetical protein